MEQRLAGLTDSEAQSLLSKYGKNTLPHKKPVGDLIILFDQIKSPLIYILILAALVSFILMDFKDAAVIFAAVILNTFLGFYQERKAQKALYALKQILNPQAKVLRNKEIVTINVDTIVPGDVVIITSGDRIPADGYVFETANLLINEAVLTGESVPVSKKASHDVKDTPSSSLAYMGTTVIAGRGKMVVTKTGLSTEFGKIASELSTTREEETPLQLKIGQFAKFLAVVFIAMSLIIFILGILSGKTFIEMFTTSVAVAVAAIPEGMAVSLTAILAFGMQRILKRKALVRKLVAAEALGSTTVIATDKTGTLTLGVMSVVKTECTDKERALEAATFANNREDALEIALWEYVSKNGLDPQQHEEKHTRVKEIPFDADKKYMASLIRKEKGNTLYVKGAPDVLLERTTLSKEEKAKWNKKINQWGSQGLRLIGCAYKDTKSTSLLDKDVTKLTWIGLIGITDPVRESVKDALVKTKQAGIKTIVITGDFASTSMAVLKKLGIIVTQNQILEGKEMEKLTSQEFERKVSEIILFARVTPSQKLQIVKALQKKGEVVALVGDGVNDAPAIKAANIGIVVAGASDVARQTADMVLLDSNFDTIVAAVEEGRGIYQNIKKVTFFLMAGSFSEIVLVMSALIFGIPLPITASQILWINIVTDGLPNLALTIDPKEKHLLKNPPVPANTQLFDPLMKTMMVVISSVTGILLLVLFVIMYQRTQDLQLARTIVFTSLGLTMLLYVFSVRTLKSPLIKTGFLVNKWLIVSVVLGIIIQFIPLYNPLFRDFLQTTRLSVIDLSYALFIPIIITLLVEFVKIAYIIPKKKAEF